MVNMENAEEVMQILERFTRLKQKEIPKELDDYLQYVAKTGDTVFKWSSLKYLFREKLLNVIKHFHETSPRVDEIPQYPNVDPFNYESMKSSLLERLELFNAAPFTIQRLCELLIDPRKQYSRIDKFMRALEKNILVVSTIEPGRKRTESENGDSLDSVVNGDLSLDVNVDIDMENDGLFNIENQNGNGSVTLESTGDGEAVVIDGDGEKPLIESNNVPRAADDDILPKPKKPKLELNSNADTDLKVEVTSEVKANEQATKSEDGIDGKDTTVSATKDEEKVKENEESKEDKILSATDIEMGEVEVSKPIEKSEIISPDEKKADEKSEKEEIENKLVEENGVNEQKGNDTEVKEMKSIVDESSVTGTQNEETDVDTAIKADEAVETNKTNSVDELKNDDKDEKIIEKQEIEKGEKEEQVHKADSTVSDVQVDAVVEKNDADEVSSEEKAKVDETDNKETELNTKETVSEAELKKSDTPKEDAITESKIEDPKKDIPQSETVSTAEAEAEADIEAEAKKTKSIDSEVEEKAKIINVVITEEAISSSTALVSSPTSNVKTDTDAEKTEPTIEKVAEANTKDQVAAATAAAAAAAQGEEKKIAESAVDSMATSTTTTATNATNNCETSDPNNPTPIETDPPIIAEEQDTPTAIVAIETQTTDTESILPSEISTTTDIDISTITPISIATPTLLTINDQPMEDTPTDEISLTSNEVVMTETGIAMATDTIESSKDEPSGMEVDDTSQEAMDQ